VAGRKGPIKRRVVQAVISMAASWYWAPELAQQYEIALSASQFLIAFFAVDVIEWVRKRGAVVLERQVGK
jgi:hypothetical protein